MTLDFEVRATRRPLPRQLEVSDWSNNSSSETHKAKANPTSGASSTRSTAFSLSTSPQGQLSTGSAFPPSYSARMPVNRYDVSSPVNNQDEWRFMCNAPASRTSFANGSSESDHSVSSGYFSSFSTAASGGDWKPQEERQKRDSWDSTAASSEYRRLPSYSRHKLDSNDDLRDNQREESGRLYSGRHDSFVDMSPLRHEREEMASAYSSSSGKGHYDKKYSFATPASSMPFDNSPRGNKSTREPNQERPFFSPFRVSESPISTSPGSRAESEESYRFSPWRRVNDESSDSESESKSGSKPLSRFSGNQPRNDSNVTTRRTLFPPPQASPTTSVAPSGYSDDWGKTAQPALSPSPSSSLSTSEFSPVTQTPPSDSSAHIEPVATKPPRDPIASMAERREELYSFRKKMREAFARMDEMVDAHREYFKSDPGSGTPIFDSEAAEEAERLAGAVFADLAGLRERFRELATDFKDSEAKEKAASIAKAGARAGRRSSIQVREPRSVAISDGDDNKDSNDGSDDERAVAQNLSTFENSRAQRKPVSASSTILDNVANESNSPAYGSSPSSPTFISDKYLSHTEEDEDNGDLTRSTVFSEEDGDDDAVSSIMNRNFSQLSPKTASRMTFPRYSPSISSLHSKSSKSLSTSSNKGDSREDGNVFQDFDKRMEEIRASLHSIARGRK